MNLQLIHRQKAAFIKQKLLHSALYQKPILNLSIPFKYTPTTSKINIRAPKPPDDSHSSPTVLCMMKTSGPRLIRCIQVSEFPLRNIQSGQFFEVCIFICLSLSMRLCRSEEARFKRHPPIISTNQLTRCSKFSSLLLVI